MIRFAHAGLISYPGRLPGRIGANTDRFSFSFSFIMALSAPDFITWFVNRSKQHQRYEEMLAGSTPMAVMLIEAPPAMGKSFLVKNLSHLTEMAGHPQVTVDFRERRTHDTLWLARFARDQLARAARPGHFNELTLTINQFTAGPDPAAGPRSLTRLLNLVIDGRSLPVEINLTEIRQLLNRLDESNIRTLTFDLGLKYDDLVGSNLAARIVDLISTCERFQLLDQLVLWGARELPHLTWWQEAAAPTSPAGMPAAPDQEVIDYGGELRANSAQARDLALGQINRAFTVALRRLLDEKRVAFLFDSFEDATDEARDWILNELLIPLFDGRYDNLLVVIAGRRVPDIGDRRPLAGRTGLDPFSIDHVREYLLEKRKIQEDDVEKIYSYCRGFPGILATMADAYTSAVQDHDDW